MSWRTLIPARLGGCPAGWQLSRALSDGADFELIAHVRGCARCGAEWAALSQASARAQSLPAPTMSEASRERIASQLVAEGSALRPTARPVGHAVLGRRGGLALLACTAAAAAVVSFRAGKHDEGRPVVVASLASIRAVGAAAFTRVQAPPDEVVRLDDGMLELDVTPPSGGRRFRVTTADAEIDGPQGRFSVEAGAHMLVAVRVFQGYVEVRASGGGRASLHAGDEWTRGASGEPPVVPAPAAGATAPAPRETPAPVVAERLAPRRRAGAPERAPAASTVARASGLDKAPSRAFLEATPSTPPARLAAATAPQRTSFERGWRLLRAGDAALAAAAFRDVDRQSGGDAISEDALFWQAVALARASLASEARAALSRFTVRFPRSARLGEASAMLGWMLVEAGDPPGARQAFQRAAHDRVDRVRASAESGLAHLDAAGKVVAPSGSAE
jgi:TolA-binding protein